MTTVTTHRKKNGSAVRRAAENRTHQPDLNLDLVRCRAYEIYLGRNGGPGDHVSDWIQAERELQEASEDLPNGNHPRGREGLPVHAETGSTAIGDGIVNNHD